MNVYIYEKISFILIFLMLTPYYSYANSGAASIMSNGFVKFDNNSELSKNVSVEKEVLNFKYNPDLNYENDEEEYFVGEKELLNLIGNKTNYLNYFNKNIVGDYPLKPLFEQEKTPTKFYKLNRSNGGPYYEVEVEYTLKNNSLESVNGNVAFSSYIPDYLSLFHLAEGVDDLSFLKTLVVMPSSNNSFKTFSLSFGGEDLDYSKKVMLGKYNVSKLFSNYNRSEKLKNLKNLLIFKEVNYFNLDFKPGETKKLVIKYIVKNSVGGVTGVSYLYDFSPIFTWKNNTLKELEINVSGGNENYYFDKEESSFGSEFVENNGVYTFTGTDLKKGDLDQIKVWFNWNGEY